MNGQSYYDETDILTNGTCNFFSYLGDGRRLHMHRQIELMVSVKGDLSVTLGQNKYHMTTGDFLIIKPFEIHSFESKKKFSNRFVSPILPDIISNRIANKLRESTIYHARGGEWGEILSLYKVFETMSQKSKMLYFQMLEGIVNDAVSLNTPTRRDTLSDKIIAYITENAAAPLTLDSVAAACCTNRCTVSKIVNNYCNQNFNGFLNRVRLNRFLQDYFENRPSNLETTAIKAGFCSTRTFYRVFYDEFKMTPRQYIEKLAASET